jgi:hypothetical protein
MAVGKITPPGPVTGYAHPGCYMAPSANCSPRLSREHLISRGLIDGQDLKVRGMPWQRDEVQRCSPDSLTARILCQRHNSSFSPLDAHARRFFLALEQARLHAQRRSLSTRSRYFMTSGTGLELWAMKTLAGLYASGIEFRAGEQRFRDYAPPMDQLVTELSAAEPNVLMTLAIPLKRDGHEKEIGRRAVSIGPIVDEDARVLEGLLIRMHGMGMHFRLDLDLEDGDPADDIVRPDMIDLVGPERTSRIYLSWQTRRTKGQIFELTIGRAPTKDKPQPSKAR